MTKEFALHLGADGWAPDAASAVDVARAVVLVARGQAAHDGFTRPRCRGGPPSAERSRATPPAGLAAAG